MKESLRVFVGIDLPPSIEKEIARIQHRLQKDNIFEGNYVDPSQAHITLAFIGEIPASRVEKIQEALQNVNMESFQALLGGIDVFTKGNTLAVIYVQVIAEGLQKLFDAISTALDPWIVLERKEFVSHITLARVKSVSDEKKFFDALRAIQVEPINFPIEAFELKESVLDQNGSQYFTLAEYKLT